MCAARARPGPNAGRDDGDAAGRVRTCRPTLAARAPPIQSTARRPVPLQVHEPMKRSRLLLLRSIAGRDRSAVQVPNGQGQTKPGTHLFYTYNPPDRSRAVRGTRSDQSGGISGEIEMDPSVRSVLPGASRPAVQARAHARRARLKAGRPQHARLLPHSDMLLVASVQTTASVRVRPLARTSALVFVRVQGWQGRAPALFVCLFFVIAYALGNNSTDIQNMCVYIYIIYFTRTCNYFDIYHNAGRI